MLADSPGEDSYKALGKSYSILYMQFYVYIGTLPTSGNFMLLAEVGQSGTYWEYGTFVGIRYYDSSARFAFRHGYIGTWVNTNIVPQINAWYCIQIKAARSETQILYINDTQVATMGQGYLSLDQVRVGTFEATYLVNVYFDCVVVADTKIAIEQNEPPPTPEKVIYKISISSTFHNNYGLGYPVTYIFQIPNASSNLKVYKRPTTAENWMQLTEKNALEFFNGIECARFDYSQNNVYVSVAFSATSDNIYIKITDQNGRLVETSFSAVAKYYDNRKAAVVATSDDWKDGDWYTDFMSATDACQARHVWLTPGLETSALSKYEDIQTQLNEGYLEIASHSRTHPTTVPYSDYDSEIGGSRDDVIGNLSLPAIYTKGSSEYVWAWLEPQDMTDATIRAKLGQYKYLIDRTSTRPTGYDDFATWDSVNGVYNRIGIVGYGDTETLQTLNNLFDSSYSAGGIYHLFFHALGLDWSPTGKIPQHLDHLKEKLDVWYAGFGSTYAYQFVKENYIIEKTQESLYWSVSVLCQPASGGTTNPSGVQSVLTNSSLTVIAAPNAGYKFENWIFDGAVISTSTTVVISPQPIGSNHTLIASFSPTSWWMNVSSNPAWGGVTNPSGVQIVPDGSSLTVTASPNADYSFKNWVFDGAVVSSSTTIVIVPQPVGSSHNLTASFESIYWSVTISSQPVAGGVTSPSGVQSVLTTSSLTVNASANVGYVFKNWVFDGAVISNSTIVVIPQEASGSTHTLIASFESLFWNFNDGAKWQQVTSGTATVHDVTTTSFQTTLGSASSAYAGFVSAMAQNLSSVDLRVMATQGSAKTTLAVFHGALSSFDQTQLLSIERDAAYGVIVWIGYGAAMIMDDPVPANTPAELRIVISNNQATFYYNGARVWSASIPSYLGTLDHVGIIASNGLASGAHVGGISTFVAVS